MLRTAGRSGEGDPERMSEQGSGSGARAEDLPFGEVPAKAAPKDAPEDAPEDAPTGALPSAAASGTTGRCRVLRPVPVPDAAAERLSLPGVIAPFACRSLTA